MKLKQALSTIKVVVVVIGAAFLAVNTAIGNMNVDTVPWRALVGTLFLGGACKEQCSLSAWTKRI